MMLTLQAAEDIKQKKKNDSCHHVAFLCAQYLQV